jgi:methyl-accepting chemotaxis protein/methyl-accepting chemotaxis protein-1 (serine sensor receptor)
MTNKNADNTQGVASLMQATAGTVEKANRSLEQMVVSMQEINTSSDKISKIIKVIDEIAFQTNILALNAAVEAARAGEAGMGFAVVADEVRNLAQRCAQAAKDTAALIEESIAKSNDGKIKLDQVAHAVHSITESASKVRTLVDEVNLGSQEQARGIEQISKGVAQMEQLTQRTAASAEQSASAGEELSAQAEAMHSVVERLSVLAGANHTDGSEEWRSIQPREKARPVDGISARAKAHQAPGSKGTAMAMVRADRHAIPLDDDFKEF